MSRRVCMPSSFSNRVEVVEKGPGVPADRRGGRAVLGLSNAGEGTACRWSLGLSLLVTTAEIGGELANPMGLERLADAGEVMVGGGITPPAANSEPCLRVSPHTAPQHSSLCHGHLVLCA